MVLTDLSYITPGSMLAVAIVPTVAAILAVGIRFWIRLNQKVPLSWDDWLLTIGLVLTIGIAITMIVGEAGHAIGWAAPPLEEQLPHDNAFIEKIQFACQLMQIFALGFIKASFVMFYRRIFCAHQKTWFSVATFVVLGVVIAWTISFFFVWMFYCGSNLWAMFTTLLNLMHYCPRAFTYQVSLAITDFIVDLMVILLPIPAIVQLKMDWRKRFLIIGVFMFGLVAIAASTARMAVTIIIFNAGYNLNLDGYKTVALILFWSIIENGAGIVAACLPTMSWLFKKEGKAILSNRFRSLISLRSMRSSQMDSMTHSRHEKLGSQEESLSSSMDPYFVGSRGPGAFEAYVEHDANGGHSPKTDPSYIHVRTDLSQREIFTAP